MGPDKSRRGEAIKRAVEMATEDLRNDVETMTELVTVSGASGGAGARPTANATGDEAIVVVEPYGFAATPPGASQALAISPGTDDENRVTLGLSAPAGRPSTDAGDAAVWTSAGHSFLLDDDGGITVTSKDGSTIDLPATGAINITAGTGASITLNVDALQSVNLGDGAALELLKAQATEDFLAAAAAYAALNFVPNDGGVKAFTSFAAFITGTVPAPPPGLTTAAEAKKAKGS